MHRSRCIYICFACLGLFLGFVCLFVFNKRQNGWTDQAQLFCGTSRMTPGKVYGWSNFQKFATNKIQFLKILKSTIFIKNVNFVFVLQCIQKEHVHNWNRRWALSALKAQCFKICLVLSKYIKWSQEIVAQSPPESPNKILILN